MYALIKLSQFLSDTSLLTFSWTCSMLLGRFVFTLWAGSLLLFIFGGISLREGIARKLESVANRRAELAHASTSDHSLIEGGVHGLLESLPAGVRRITKLAVVRLKLHELGLTLHANGLRWLGLVFWRSLNIIYIALLAVFQGLAELLSKHFFSSCTKLSCMRGAVIKWFLFNYKNQGREKITEEEFFVGTLWHLNSLHGPFVKHNRSNECRVLEVVTSQASSLPRFMILNLLCQLLFSPQSWNVVRFALHKKESKLIDWIYHFFEISDCNVLYSS